MAKPRPWFGYCPAVFLMRCKKGIEGNLSQRDDHADIAEQIELLNEVRPAARKFNPARFIIRRRAPDGGGNVAIREFQTVISMNGVGLIGKTGSVERSVEPVATAIACEYSAGSIASVGRRREADNQKTRIRIAEAR